MRVNVSRLFSALYLIAAREFNLKILMLAHYYPPETGGATSRLSGLARWLRAYGHEVTVITGFPNYPSGTIPDMYKGKWWAHEQMDGVDLLRVWVFARPYRKSWQRLANYFSFVFSASMAAIFHRGRYDLVFASSPPLFIGLAGVFWSLVRRLPLVFDIRDLWPEVAVEAGAYARDSLFVRISEKLERFFYRRSTRVVAVTNRKLEKLADRGVPAHKLALVENGVDLDLMTDIANDDLRVKYGIQNKFVCVYAGLIGVCQGVGMILDAAQRLHSTGKFHFLIAGDGVERPMLEKQAAENGLDNVTFLGSLPKSAIPGMIKTADLPLVPLSNTNIDDAIPSKLLEAWACKKPLLFMGGGEARRLVDSVGGGLSTDPDGASVAIALQQLQADPEAMQRAGALGFAYVRDNLDRPALARKLEAVFEEMLTHPKGPR